MIAKLVRNWASKV